MDTNFTGVVFLTLVCVVFGIYNFLLVFRPDVIDKQVQQSEPGHRATQATRRRVYKTGGCIGLCFTTVFFLFLLREVIALLR
jgi:hypothetical protein